MSSYDHRLKTATQIMAAMISSQGLTTNAPPDAVRETAEFAAQVARLLEEAVARSTAR